MFPYPITVYVPAGPPLPGGRRYVLGDTIIGHGWALVGTTVRESFERDGDDPDHDRVVVDYEPTHSLTLARRCADAATRLYTHADTELRLCIPASDVIAVGTYDPGTGRITVDEEQRTRLADWVGLIDWLRFTSQIAGPHPLGNPAATAVAGSGTR
jgi:hypothetical protein